MNIKPTLFLLLIFITRSFLGYTQQKTIDSLKKVLLKNKLEDTNRVNTFNELAYAYYQNNKWNEVKIYSLESIALSQKLKYTKGEAFAYRRLGSEYLQDNANPLTLECLNKAYGIFKHLKDTLNCARTLTNIGLYYHTIKDYSLSLSYFLSALRQAEKIKRYKMQILLLGNLGDIYEKEGQINKAHTNYAQSLALAIKINDAGYFSFCYANLASIYFKEKDYRIALNLCNKVLALQKINNPINLSDVTQALLIKSNIYIISKDFEKSRLMLNQSMLLAQKTHKAEDRLQIYRDFFLLDSAQHNYEAALKSNYLFIKLNDSLINVSKNQVAAFYNVKFNSQLREDENKELRMLEEKNRIIINKQRIIQAALFIGLILICFGFIYFNNVNKQIKAKNTIIAAQNIVLESSNVVKDKLFSVISHDLRSPITQVINMLNLWESGKVNNEELSEIIPLIKVNTISTLELLDNLLIWSTKQLDGFSYTPELFDIHNQVNENINELKNNTRQKKLIIENLVPAGTKLYADSAMVKIILRNLISNAVKFTPQLGTISVNSYNKNDEFVLYVKDTGIGIKKADKEKLFSFTKHTTKGTDNEIGTGLGLRISREFIEMNKGKIWLESEETAGTTFFISFPVSKG